MMMRDITRQGTITRDERWKDGFVGSLSLTYELTSDDSHAYSTNCLLRSVVSVKAKLRYINLSFVHLLYSDASVVIVLP